jgi:hypothetical protein
MSTDFANDLFLEIRIGKRKRPLDLARELEISSEVPAELNRQMTQQPAKYAWVAVLHALAVDHHEKERRRHKVLCANLDKKHRARREGANLKATEAIIAADIERDDEFEISMERVEKARLNKDLLMAAVTAFVQRKDMLVSVGSYVRQQMDSDITILKEKAKKTLKERKKRK